MAFAGYKMWKNKQDKDSENENFIDEDFDYDYVGGISKGGEPKDCSCPTGDPNRCDGTSLMSCSECCSYNTQSLMSRSRRRAVKRRFDGETEGDEFNESYGL
jgi:hypothetical protein